MQQPTETPIAIHVDLEFEARTTATLYGLMIGDTSIVYDDKPSYSLKSGHSPSTADTTEQNLQCYRKDDDLLRCVATNLLMLSIPDEGMKYKVDTFGSKQILHLRYRVDNGAWLETNLFNDSKGFLPIK